MNIGFNIVEPILRAVFHFIFFTPDHLIVWIGIPAAIGAYFAWGRFEAYPSARRAAAAGTLAFELLDALLLASLPRLGLSFGRLGPALLGFTAGRVVLGLAIAWTWRVGSYFCPQALSRRGAQALLLLCGLVNLGLLGAAIDSLYIEPFRLQISQVQLTVPFSRPGRPLRILHLTDLHLERLTRRERRVLEAVQSLQPDLIALTGDYLNLDYLYDPLARQQARDFLAQLQAPYGVYAVRGTVDGDGIFEALFEGLDIVLLEDRLVSLSMETGQVSLLGVANWDLDRDRQALEKLAVQTPQGSYSILLYHTPDLVEAAARAGIDLYLAGHTHGGQVRLPFYGALFTASIYGRRFQSGQYTLDGMTLYVSRGIGMEGLGAPRMRFLCPPEVVLLTLSR